VWDAHLQCVAKLEKLQDELENWLKIELNAGDTKSNIFLWKLILINGCLNEFE
jgi:hypothetical protein